MSSNSSWPGIVSNRSTSPVWVIWDEGEGDQKKWKAQPLEAGRRSPKGLDIDGVRSHRPGVRITSLDWLGHVKVPTFDWWWLVRGAEVDIKDGYAMQTIEVTSTIGSLKVVPQSDVNSWNVTYLPFNPSWGEKL